MKEFKKYIIGFIIGLLGIATFTYASDNGSIGNLFKLDSGSWVLMGNNIEESSISKTKLTTVLSGIIDTNTAKVGITTAQSNAIIANTAKVGITTAQSNAIIANTAKTVFSGDYNDLINNPTIPVDSKLTETEVVAMISNNGYITSTLSGTFNVKEICDENGDNCVTVSDGLGGGNSSDCTYIGSPCIGGLYLGNNIVVQSSDLGAYNWSNAITACSNSVVGGQSDWVLPTKTQLNSLYQQKNTIGGFSRDRYWSSTETDSSSARLQRFYNGNQSFNGKSNSRNVRCIRTF